MHPDTLLRLAQASAAAYEFKSEESDAYLRDAEIYVIKEISDPDGAVRGFVGINSDFYVISIRGTASLKDALIDGTIIKSSFLGDTEVHLGFQQEHDNVLRQLIDLPTDRPIYITGHSLGGAVAHLIAVSLKTFVGGIDVRVVTFGSPRVGNRAFAKLFNRTINEKVRVVHNVDIVPRIPKFGWTHADRILHLTDDGKRIGAARTFFSEIWHFLKIAISDLDQQALNNHHVAAYVAAMAGFKRRHHERKSNG